MVLTLKRWKSRTPPGIVAGEQRKVKPIHKSKGCPPTGDGPFGVFTRGGAARLRFASQTVQIKRLPELPSAAFVLVTRGGAAR